MKTNIEHRTSKTEHRNDGCQEPESMIKELQGFIVKYLGEYAIRFHEGGAVLHFSIADPHNATVFETEDQAVDKAMRYPALRKQFKVAPLAEEIVRN